MSSFLVNWVLIDQLAIGIAPSDEDDLNILKDYNIISILSLCSQDEARPPAKMNSMFNCKRIVLPDHKSNSQLTIDQLDMTIDTLRILIKQGPVFIHCLVAIERSPIVCMHWLIKEHNLSFQDALEFMMQVHPSTSPLTSQLNLLNNN